jgi:hypothetical protein
VTIEFLKETDGWFWLLLIATILTLFWIIISIKEERKFLGLIGIRICVFIVLLFILLSPKFSWKDHYQYPLRWNIYADRSVSMGYHQALSPNTYLNNLNSLFSEAESKNAETQKFYFDYRVYNADETSFLLDGEATDLGNVFDHIKESESELAGAIIITDGQITKGEQTHNQLKEFMIPIFTVGVGDTIPLVDIAIQAVEVPTVIIKGEEMDINITLSSHGRINDRINILLYKGKKLLGSKYIHLEGDGSLANAKFRISPQTLGGNNYIVKTSVLADEINIDNNSQPFQVSVLKDKYKLALITGAPNFNTAPLKKIIRNIPRVELDHYIQRDDKFIPSINEFWSTPYELIVFDNFPLVPISKRWKQILAKKIVSQKSSVFLFVGPNTEKKATESMYPFFHVKNSQETFNDNKSKQWYWAEENNILKYFSANGLDQARYDNIYPPLKPKLFIEPENNISSLAYFDNSSIPLLVSGEIEGLRSGIWTSSDFSTLFYKMTETDQENISTLLINNLFSWFLRTSGENDLYFRVNKDVFQQGEEIHIAGSHFNKEVKDIFAFTGYITLLNEENSPTTYELTYNPVNEQWETKFLAGKPGSYSYEIVMENENEVSTQIGSLLIDESQIELNQVSVNKEKLITIANATNGKYVSWESRAEIIDRIKQEHKEEIVVRDVRLNEYTLGILLLVILLSIEWYIRRHIGLS